MTGKPQVCTHRGCTDKTVARRLCKRHYQAAWYAGKLGQHKKQPPRKKDPKICPPEHRHAGGITTQPATPANSTRSRTLLGSV